PMARERADYLGKDRVWGYRNLAAHDAESRDLDAAVAVAKARGGRAYAGLAAGWGASFKVGDVPLYGFLSTAAVPAVGFLYHSMALTGDVMLRFDERNPDHYRLFNVRTAIAPIN